MPQADRDNSVVFSLNELRQIEEQRVEEETVAQQQQAAQERAAQEAAERAEREAREAAERAEREAEERRLAAIESQKRAEALKVKAAENQVKIKQEAKIAEEKLAAEMSLRMGEAQKKKPIGLLLLSGLLVIGLAGFAYFAYAKISENQRVAAENDATAKRLADFQIQIREHESQMSELQAELAKGVTPEQAAQLRQQIADLEAKKARREKSRQAAKNKANRAAAARAAKRRRCKADPFASGC